MSSGFITAFAMIAFVAIVIWVFAFKRKEDFDEQAHLPLDEDDRDDGQRPENKQKDKENSS
ncbi:MAG: cbb3-type cytochrome c oxidase subunit 3 [Xanthomonadales bacterium]|nr:cbb3-type cytochrome c oxidase subunit 3 [Xanthomonadales bacterium]